MMPVDVQRMPPITLLDALEQAIGERCMLIESDAPDAELHNVQRTIDDLKEEINRRMSW